MKTEKIKISKIQTNANNPRLVKDDKYKKLVKSIKEFPEMLQIRPIVVDKDNIVLGGNMRLRACQEAGLKEVYIIKADQLTEKQQREFIIKDNVGFGEWDWDELANTWDSEELNEWGLEVWNDKDLDLDKFFEEDTSAEGDTGSFKITLEYTEEDYNEVIELFSKQKESKEQLVFNMLKNM